MDLLNKNYAWQVRDICFQEMDYDAQPLSLLPTVLPNVRFLKLEYEREQFISTNPQDFNVVVENWKNWKNFESIIGSFVITNIT